MIANLKKKWETSVSTQIAHYNRIKGSSKQPESFKNCIVRFKILVLTSKVCFLGPNSSRDVWVKSFIFLNLTLISRILLKLDRTRAKFWQRKWSVVSILPPEEHIGLTICYTWSYTWDYTLKLYLNVCLLSCLMFTPRRVSNFKPRGSDI